MMPDDLLFNASEAQLRNVLAMISRSMPDTELIALFEREEKMTAREAREEREAETHRKVVFIDQR